MAIFSLNHSFVSRGSGHNIFQRAAYNSRSELEDREGNKFNFKSDDLLYEEISVPLIARSWLKDRKTLWRTLDAREDQNKRSATARLAHSFIIALPSEFSTEQNVRLMKDFVHEQFTRKGFACDWAMHRPPEGGDQRNVHVHLLVSLRSIDRETGLWSDKKFWTGNLGEQVTKWRKSWAGLTNRHLKRYGFAAKIDHRSNAAQAIKRPPGRHRGLAATRTYRRDQLAASLYFSIKRGQKAVKTAIEAPKIDFKPHWAPLPVNSAQARLDPIRPHPRASRNRSARSAIEREILKMMRHQSIDWDTACYRLGVPHLASPRL